METRARSIWCAAALSALFLLPTLIALAQEDNPVAPPTPPLTIVLKGGAGTIKADRTWNDGANLCWEARGIRNCTLRKFVAFIRSSPGDLGGPRDPNFPLVQSASLQTMGSNLRFVGYVRNGSYKTWPYLSLLVRFFDRDGNFRGQDTVPLVPSNILPDQIASFDHSVYGDQARLYVESDPVRGALIRRYDFLTRP